MVNRLAAVAVFIAFVPASAAAQGASFGVQPYAFVAPGRVNSGDAATMHAGGGVDVIHRSGLGIGTEVGFLGPFPDGFDYGVGLASVSGSYRWLGVGAGRTVPFVNGGLTTAVLRGFGTGWHAGAGVDWWMREGFGLRLEFRDHIPLEVTTICGEPGSV